MLFAILFQFRKVGHQVLSVEFIFFDLNLLAHVRSEFLLKVAELNVAFLFGVEDVVHQRNDLVTAGMDLVLSEVLLEIGVRNVAIAIDVHTGKSFVESRLGFKCLGLDFDKKSTQAFVTHFTVCGLKSLVQHSRRRVGADPGVDNPVQSNRVFLEHKRSDVGDRSAAVLVEDESRHEAFDVLLGDLACNQLLTALVNQECFEVVDAQVTIDVTARFVSKCFFKRIFVGELSLHVAVHLDQLTFDVIDLVLGHFLAIYHGVVRGKNVFLGLCSGERVGAI